MLFERLHLKNVLSFGPDSPALDLQPLNVLIGPNGSGKSNLLDAISLLNAAPEDIGAPLYRTDDISGWIWGRRSTPAELTVDLAPEDGDALRYGVKFALRADELCVLEERLTRMTSETADDSACLLRPPTNPTLRVSTDPSEALLTDADGRTKRFSDLNEHESILNLVDSPWSYPEIGRVADRFRSIRIHRDWTFGTQAPLRRPQQTSHPSGALMESAANLGLVLNRLNQDVDAKQRLIEAIKELYEGISDILVNVENNGVTVSLREGAMTVSAARLSDGTLRYLCLVAVLCHPEPPRLVCLEEPELGLHPDILPKLGDLLVDASSRCQLIVTTHSDTLVDKLSHTPESVVVCEKREGQTVMTRLGGDELQHWLKRYSLGELWTRGELGGTRW